MVLRYVTVLVSYVTYSANCQHITGTRYLMVMPVSKKQNKSVSGSSKSSVSAASASSASSVGSQGTPSDGAAGRLKGSRRKPVKCAVCDQNVVDGKDQALFCDGNCQRWFHRYCAKVTVNHFETLSSTSQPFHCIGCFQQLCNAEMMLLRESICSLKEEVTELRNALDEMKRTPSSSQADT